MTEPSVVRPLQLDHITAIIIDAALRLHRDIGPRLLESLYVKLLAGVLECRLSNLTARRHFPDPPLGTPRQKLPAAADRPSRP